MQSLKGKLLTWSLNQDNPTEGDKFFQTTVKYGVFRKYVFSDVYNPETNDGEQRVGGERHLSRIRSAIENGDYTPQTFNASILDISQANIDNSGNIEFPLSENNKLALLDGGTRFRALEKIRSSKEKYQQPIDNLPVPLLVYFQPEKRKRDFANLNAGQRVNRSHLESLNIAAGRVKAAKQKFKEQAKELSLLLNSNEDSPLYNKITFGNTDDTGRVQFSQLVTDHSSALITSLYTARRLLKLEDKTNEDYVKLFIDLYDLAKERTDTTSKGKLLALPPDGAKGNVNNFVSVVNCTLYYLYLQKQIDNSDELSDNSNHIISSLRVYDNLVAGDIGMRRRQNLSQMYAQKLFSEILQVDECPTGSHFGIPIALIAMTSHGTFNVEALPGLKRSRKSKPEITNEDNE